MAKAKSAIKVKKKQWVEIVAPKVFNEKVIGESPMVDPAKLIGRPVLVNMMALTNDPKKQNVSLKFTISFIGDNKAKTKSYGYYLSVSFLRRLMRRATTRIDDSFLVETGDKLKVRVKPFMLTRKKVPGSIATALRAETRRYVAKQLSKTPYEQVIGAAAFHKFQRSLSSHLKRIYPLKTCEIRAMYIEKEKKGKKKSKLEKVQPELVKKEESKDAEKKSVEEKGRS